MAGSAAPSNDEIINSRPITGSTITQSTAGATTAGGEDLTAETNASLGATVWYSYTAQANGPVSINTNGSNFDTTLQVYSLRNAAAGPSYSNLAEIGSNDDNSNGGNPNNVAFFNSTVNFNAVAGQTYYVQAGGRRDDVGGIETGNLVLNAVPAPCYVTGTAIRALVDGAGVDVAVENLRIGDLAITAAGAHRPIRWIGHRMVDCSRHAEPHSVQPIRIAAGAFGESRPLRDLTVSPGHAICFDMLGEVLIPAVALVNGSTITQQDVETVTYWHIELDSHDVLLAEGQAAESYLDMGNRGFFTENGVISLHATPDGHAMAHAKMCRPFHGGGVLVEVVRAQLQVRAEELGWQLDDTPLADMHLVVDGKRIDADAQGLVAQFSLPSDARNVWLVSQPSSPREIGLNADMRRLGLCLKSMTIEGDGTESHVVALDNPELCDGFHKFEGHCRWTAGRSRLPAALFEGFDGMVVLRIELARAALPRWIAPQHSGPLSQPTATVKAA